MDNSQFGGVSYNQQADHFGDNILGNQINNYIKLEPLPEIDLNEALALLQALPTKVLPQAAPEQLPAWSRFQRLQQAYFVGRDTELLQIARTLKQGSTCLITTGIAGAGKSSLASEFAYRYGSYFAGGVFWLSFADTQNIANEIAECGNKLRLCIAGYDPNDEEQGQQRKQALNRLLELGLLEQLDQDQLRIHGLIANYCQRTQQESSAQERVEAVLVRISHNLVNTKIPSLLSPILPHLYHCYRAIEQQDTVRNANLAMALGRAEQGQNNYRQAEPLYLRALRIYETALGAEHPTTATSLNNLAGVYDAQERYGEAEPLYLRALRIYETALGAEHPTTATSLNNLAALYQAQGRYGEAEPLYLRTLRITETALDAEHPDTALSLNNLALLYKAQGRYGEAEPLLERALRIREQALGAEHPTTAQLLNNLAAVYQAQGRYGEAEPLLKRALRITETALGAEHPDTAQSLNNLAAVYQAQGRYGEAEPLFERALRINETALGAQHPDTQGVCRGLEFTQHLANELTQAQAAVQQALNNPSINRLALAQQITALAQHFAEGEETGSPYYVLAEQLRVLITKLDLEHYTPPSEEQQIAEQLANAEALVGRALSDQNIDRRAVAQRLEQAIQQWESSGPESPWYTAATQLRGLIAQLDLENYTPLSEQQLIDELIALYQSAFVDACNNPNINHVELQQNLEGLARWAARNQEVHIGYLRLSTELNALAAQLRNA